MVLTLLDDRALIKVSGSDACNFLQGVFTNDVKKLKDIMYGMILNHQGRFLYEIFLINDGDSILIDHSACDTEELLVFFYERRFRSKLQFAKDDRCVFSSEVSGIECELLDPRDSNMGFRIYRERMDACDKTRDYHIRRMHLRIPDGIADMVKGVSMPLDFRLAELNGISFTKGCYCGQEAVSKARHILGKKRDLYCLESVGSMHIVVPTKGCPIRCSGEVVGKICGSISKVGLGLFNIDNSLCGKLEADGVEIAIRK